MTRRLAVQGGAALTGFTIGVIPPASTAPFAGADVRRTARELARHPLQEPDLKLRPGYTDGPPDPAPLHGPT